MGRVKRFLLHWMLFATFVILCSVLVMLIEGGEQSQRQVKRMQVENEINDTKNSIYRYVYSMNGSIVYINSVFHYYEIFQGQLKIFYQTINLSLN